MKRGDSGRPTGSAAAKLLGLKQVTALISPDGELAYRNLALNTEKAHNLKDRSLEVIRMARALAACSKRSREDQYADQFESAALLTLGFCYEDNGRFAGGAYHPLLRKVDRFSGKTLPSSPREREGHASCLLQIDGQVKQIIEALRERGFKSPYLRNFVVARINPVCFHRAKKGSDEPLMTLSAALTRMAASARKFDAGSVRDSDLALVAALSSESET